MRLRASSQQQQQRQHGAQQHAAQNALAQHADERDGCDREFRVAEPPQPRDGGHIDETRDGRQHDGGEHRLRQIAEQARKPDGDDQENQRRRRALTSASARRRIR